MLGSFTYCNPTKLYFGEDAMGYLKEELEKYGPNVLLVYGGGSIKKNGIYDEVMSALKETGKTVAEDPGVMPNPTVHKLYAGLEIARALQPEECKNVIRYPADGTDILRYLKCETLSVDQDLPAGWYLICADDCPLGWAKVQNGTLKNKYPPGWRIL